MAANGAAAAPPQAPFELVLQKLSLGGRDALAGALDRASFKAARLACKSLRDVVDGSRSQLVLVVGSAHMQRVAAASGAAPPAPLWRWPRLVNLTILIELDIHHDGVDACTLLALPLLGNPPGCCLSRIQRLTLLSSDNGNIVWLPAAGLAALLCRLPGLRAASFDGALSDEPVQQMLLYDILASVLPYLEELNLPSAFFLQFAGRLAAAAAAVPGSAAAGGGGGGCGGRLTRLTRLELNDLGERRNFAVLQEGWLRPALASLRGLRSLHLDFYRLRRGGGPAADPAAGPNNGGGGGGDDDALFLELLEHLPPDLETLELELDLLRDPQEEATPQAVLSLESQRIVAVEIAEAVPLGRLARFLGGSLLPCSRLAPVLRLLRLGGLWLGGGKGQQGQQGAAAAAGAAGQEEPPEGEEELEQQLRRVRQLAGRCTRVQLSELFLRDVVAPGVVVRTLDALGVVLPERVYCLDSLYGFRLNQGPRPREAAAGEARRSACDAASSAGAAAAAVWSAGAAAAAAAGGGPMDRRRALEALLGERVLARLTDTIAAAVAAGTAAERRGGGGDGGGGDGMDIDGGDTGDDDDDGAFHLVVLRSPSFRLLALAPEALLAWMRQLAAQAAAATPPLLPPVAVSLSTQGAYEGEPAPAHAHVVWYLPVPSSAAVLVECRTAGGAAAVAAAAEWAFAAAGEGVGGAAAAAVEVHALALKPLPDWPSDSWLFQQVFPVVQEFWDSGAGGGERERLQLLLELGCVAAGGGPVVELKEQEGEGDEGPEGAAGGGNAG
ncbi:hypothetical protein PLESTB_000972600 [Pleodorina starrii]|uniref:Uncharacterized protein n=1 Tax=Pleodorina starrii TaxID=330485 RepID=A0A9W6BNF2_9CHLO|nr:hypothetical protein PLESTM_001633900 [Pleodorina starrii]GLC55324.1 hypothetical protein PLESTB_000972600 [Pleodorina starrii]GLC76311.1 hypothetical protein PLESTF_001765300 [Pleodorina starrii]